MRYLVRQGDVPRKGDYWSGPASRFPHEWETRENAWAYISLAVAEVTAKNYGGRVVPLLNHKEAIAKAEERGRVAGIIQAMSKLGDYKREALRLMLCPCQGALEDPGPTHVAACPWSDPEYSEGDVF